MFKISRILFVFLCTANLHAMDKFYNFDEYKKALDSIGENVIPIVKLCNDSIQCDYVSITREVGFFNFKKNQGWICVFTDAQNEFLKSGINLREVLAIQFGGIRYSRLNYLRTDVVNLLESDTMYNYLVDNSTFQPFDDDRFRILNKYLRQLSEQELMEIELKLVVFFAKYGQIFYKNEILYEERINQFGESYTSINLKSNHGSIIQLSEIVFRTIYPDFDRDDFDEERDVKIDVKGIKEYIDYHNSERLIGVQQDD